MILHTYYKIESKKANGNVTKLNAKTHAHEFQKRNV